MSASSLLCIDLYLTSKGNLVTCLGKLIVKCYSYIAVIVSDYVSVLFLCRA